MRIFRKQCFRIFKMAGVDSGANRGQLRDTRKALFRSPDQDENSKTPEALEALLNRIQVDIEVDSNLKSLQKEIHEQTLTKLRQELTQISQDEWMYKPIDQIMGF
ncbi:anaphase-promoting complex subunit 16-like [Orbicella faveolata]|uniref:anaphase-promoting complex subunit 16-like n=1 Tax=Orbicella faveolata TaxID=48498 RepID=UPI0009E2B51A|nr:anaphase-promoting complex subunit 16-like [Orbicella faveolata]